MQFKTPLAAAVLAASLFAILASPAAAQGQAKSAEKAAAAVKVGDKVSWLADYTLASSKGDKFAFADWFKARKADTDGKPALLVVNFWSVSCPWQIAWDPELSAITSEYQPKGVTFVSVDSNITEQSSLEKINGSLKTNKISFPVLMDAGHQIADRFGAKTTPHLFVIDRTGTVVYTGAPDNDARKRMPAEERRTYLRDALDASLAGKEVATPATKPQGCTIKRGRRDGNAS